MSANDEQQKVKAICSLFATCALQEPGVTTDHRDHPSVSSLNKLWANIVFHLIVRENQHWIRYFIWDLRFLYTGPIVKEDSHYILFQAGIKDQLLSSSFLTILTTILQMIHFLLRYMWEYRHLKENNNVRFTSPIKWYTVNSNNNQKNFHLYFNTVDLS